MDICSDCALSELSGFSDLAIKVVETRKHIVYPMVYLLIELALILHVATATIERAFSAMNINKNRMQNRMGDEWLNDCLVTYIEKDVFDSVENEKIVQSFQNMKTRRYVVPYNPTLLMRYQAHINVEYCNKSNAIKYLFKYINKGANRAMLEISQKDNDAQAKEPVDEGCTSYRSIRTVKGVTYDTFKEACDQLGLLTDDKEYIDAIKEVSDLASREQMRKLFVRMLMMNSISKPIDVWESCWLLISEGILHHRRKELHNPGLRIADADLKNLCIIEIEKLLQRNGRSLNDYPCLPTPEYDEVLQFDNIFIVDELNYDKDALKVQYEELLSMLTPEQKSVYERVVTSVLSNSGGFYFLYGYGGTGKTFVWNTLSASLRSKGLIVLTVASSGIASLLLPGGRTAHSKFCIPLDATETSTCNIKQGSLRAKLLLETSLIIWDEAPMLKKYCFEALDVTLRDLLRSKNEDNAHKPFGGKVVILGGDFRQILPIITRESRQEIVESTVNSSSLWKHCKVMKLTKNMRLTAAETADEAIKIKDFADWILKIGNDDHPDSGAGEYEVQIPPDLLIPNSPDPLMELIRYTYRDLAHKMKDPHFFQDRAILAPTLEAVEMINTYMLEMIAAPEHEYLSSDSALRSDEDSEIQGEWFTTEFFNDTKSSGMPNHKLLLKVGTPIMLLRNLDQAAGLCNGTRLIVNELGERFIGATVITGTNVNDKVRQFPIAIYFAMTINKSQGQTLSQVDLFLPRPVFTHGQLYVALSRARSRKGLKLCILDEGGKQQTSTINVVFKEVFGNV
ncbi:uncharacterized protein LOC130712347 [Lotus japonicus]|uniref:uncharacterized protein LOC130712347 n=1 Tax=Lotus japonicus TaxID=34305 RepID=UPI00258E4BDB|nr:uncharacterized protein LOC130712347 [Lotus japonicus]